MCIRDRAYLSNVIGGMNVLYRARIHQTAACIYHVVGLQVNIHKTSDLNSNEKKYRLHLLQACGTRLRDQPGIEQLQTLADISRSMLLS